MSKTSIYDNLRDWMDARTRYRLSDAHVQMARDLSLNPRQFGKMAPNRQEPWRHPLPEFIEHLYFKRFGLRQPEVVRSLEELARRRAEKDAARREQRLQAGAAAPANCDTGDAPASPESAVAPAPSGDVGPQ